MASSIAPPGMFMLCQAMDRLKGRNALDVLSSHPLRINRPGIGVDPKTHFGCFQGARPEV